MSTALAAAHDVAVLASDNEAIRVEGTVYKKGTEVAVEPGQQRRLQFLTNQPCWMGKFSSLRLQK
jgi:hypothetical protein